MKKLISLDMLDELWQLPLMIVLKHSVVCARSTYALWAVEEFEEQRPDLPVYVLRIQVFPGLSKRVEERSGVRHASPQALVLRQGAVAAVASEDDITVDWLYQQV